MPRVNPHAALRGFTLIELMVSVGILLAMGVMIIGFLRGALDISRTGAARGEALAASQTVMRLLGNDLAQVLDRPAHADGPMDDPAFVVVHDPFGRQVLAFTRAWGEGQRTLAGYDSGRASPGQGYDDDFSGRNVHAAMRPSRGNIEVVYMMEPSADGTRLYRAERSPPDPRNGLISAVLQWCEVSGPGDEMAQASLREIRVGDEPLWDQFQLVAEDIVCLAVECWDDAGQTRTWFAGAAGPVYTWSLLQRQREGKPLLPRSLRATLIVATADPIRAETTLSAGAPRGDTSLFVEMTDNFNDPASDAGFARVNGEIIAYGARSGRTLGSCVRGALGSLPADHQAGSRVLGGEVFRRVIQLPVAR